MLDSAHSHAAALADLLRNAPVSAIFSTDTMRTRKTVEPVAKATGLTTATYPPQVSLPVESWTRRLLSQHRKGDVLIASHSGPASIPYNVASIVQALSGKPVAEIGGNEFSNLLVVTVLQPTSGGPDLISLRRMWYGPLESTGKITVKKAEGGPAFQHNDQVSAVAKVGDFLVVGVDEEDFIQVLKTRQRPPPIRRRSPLFAGKRW